MEAKNSLSVKIKFGAAEFEAEGTTEDVNAAKDSFLGFIKEYSETLIISNNNFKTITNSSREIAIEGENTKGIDAGCGVLVYNSFNEMKRSFGLSSNTDIVMGAAYYLSMHDKIEKFTSQDIKELLQKTKNKTKINVSQFIAANIGKGLIEEVGLSDKKQKEYRVLDSVNDWVQGLENIKN